MNMCAYMEMVIIFCMSLAINVNRSYARGQTATITQQGLHISGYTPIGTHTVLRCEYTKADPSDVLAKLTWSMGPNPETFVRIVNYNFQTPNVPEYNPNVDKEHYEMNNADINNGISDLTIFNVTSNDHNKYWCNLLFRGITFGPEDSIDVKISSPPESLTLTYDEQTFSGDVEAGKTYPIKCKAISARPASALSWTLDGDSVDPSEAQQISSNGEFWDSESIFELTPTVENNNEIITCIASVPPTFEKSTTATLSVSTPPDPTNKPTTEQPGSNPGKVSQKSTMIAIGVGCGCGCIIILAIVTLLVVRCRKSKP